MSRNDNLDALPFADTADPDPNALTFTDDDESTYAARATADGHPFRATRLVPGWCVRCGCSREVHRA